MLDAALRGSRHVLKTAYRRARAFVRRGLRRSMPARARLFLPAAALLLMFGLYACVKELPPPPPRTSEPAKRPEGTMVRVALADGAREVALRLEGEWYLAREDATVDVPVQPGDVTVRPTSDGLTVAGVMSAQFPATRVLRLRPGSADPPPVFGLGKRRYRGELELRRQESGALLAIDHVALEDYLPQVISWEMPINWEDAAVEAQAIAARTYAVADLKPGKAYDLFADERSQVFGGVPESPKDDLRARTIVQRTRGRVVVYGGQLVTTYFHSTCGGDTVPAHWIFSWEKEEKPALAGASDCPCQASKYYTWEAKADLRKGVRDLVLELPLREVKVEHWPRGGYVKSITLVDAGGDVEVMTGEQARRAFGLRSPSWSAKLEADGSTLTVAGRGWGHGVGMCQFGANGQAKKGLDAIAIIQHYYPGASVETRRY